VKDRDEPAYTNAGPFSWNEPVFLEECEYEEQTRRLTPKWLEELDIMQEIGGGIKDG
jgi:hypothetical protein